MYEPRFCPNQSQNFLIILNSHLKNLLKYLLIKNTFFSNARLRHSGLISPYKVERISIECYETKFHVITVANQKKDKHHKGPMGTQSRNNLTA